MLYRLVNYLIPCKGTWSLLTELDFEIKMVFLSVSNISGC